MKFFVALLVLILLVIVVTAWLRLWYSWGDQKQPKDYKE